MKKLLAFFVSILCLVPAVNASQEFVKGHGDTITVSSKYIDPAMNVVVVTPGDYDKGDRRYPVVYLLHGYSDNFRCWPTRTQPALDSLASVWNMIFVCPDGRDSWYFDSYNDPKKQMESFITGDLVPYIDKNYRTIPDAKHRAITGLSMGGHGAMWLAMRHPDIWRNVGSTSGGVNIAEFPNRWKIADALGEYESNKDRWENSSVMSLVPTLEPGKLNIIFDCGVDDFFYKVNTDLHNELLKAGIPHDFVSRPGAHTHPYWRNALLFQLQFFNEQFK